jgi:acetyl esterase/lipase
LDYRNIPYHDDHPRQLLDLYLPDGVEKFPVVVWVSGGGWVEGRNEWVAPVGKALREAGIGVAAVMHRLSPEVSHPAHVEDVARGIGWVLDYIAEYGGDLSRLAVGGHSAGAHLTALAALDPRYLGDRAGLIRGVLSLSGAMRITEELQKRFKNAFPGDAAALAAASPVSDVQPGVPPFLLLIAEDEQGHVVASSEEMRQTLKQQKVPMKYQIIPGRNHYDIAESIGSPGDATTQVLVDWLTTLFQEKKKEVNRESLKW